MSKTGRFRELLRKYGKVALVVHFSVSAASITGLYAAIKSNVDVESILEKVGVGAVTPDPNPNPDQNLGQNEVMGELDGGDSMKKRNRTAEIAASSGGALALAFLCNKALFPIRVPITIALTPTVARVLRRRNVIRSV